MLALTLLRACSELARERCLEHPPAGGCGDEAVHPPHWDLPPARLPGLGSLVGIFFAVVLQSKPRCPWGPERACQDLPRDLMAPELPVLNRCPFWNPPETTRLTPLVGRVLQQSARRECQVQALV